ncbi:helix-turn-helix transcriptional regulator [Salmonirosea aquatica]|uniref:Helix-turn-helix domain-containing protein n=1 Tax=Salmonirosea aquatica TaxID=2654236 RepID=A0A7C9FB66_9BACT|nr:helix-turn-helix domain-containing protein [Cytophagaceae bacterium SJW1-29]
MELNDKIKQILVDKSISPSHFADEIGVQRSSISHILAGRNRPSLDIVQKIIRRYPDLGMEWILEDEEYLDLPITSTPYGSRAKAENSPSIPSKRNGLDLPIQKSPSIDPVQTNPEPLKDLPFEAKTVERILIFYSDGTFKQYVPE